MFSFILFPLPFYLNVQSVNPPSPKLMEKVSQSFHSLECYPVNALDVCIEAPFVDDYKVRVTVYCTQNLSEFDKIMLGKGRTLEEACCDCCHNVMSAFNHDNTKRKKYLQG